ncbi:hypothetical protein [Corynebacterium halotolerans]|uniref:hypothetical protein n=1 Tax=Corynebacterium halotolerans TaxID=225326 RepID=UPI003CE9304C
MLIDEETGPIEELFGASEVAVRVPSALDDAAARDLIEGVIATVNLLDLPEIHVWAEAADLPLLAVAAAGIAELPEGFQLNQVDAATGGIRETATTWLSYESVVQLAHTQDAAEQLLAA